MNRTKKQEGLPKYINDMAFALGESTTEKNRMKATCSLLSEEQLLQLLQSMSKQKSLLKMRNSQAPGLELDTNMQ